VTAVTTTITLADLATLTGKTPRHVTQLSDTPTSWILTASEYYLDSVSRYDWKRESYSHRVNPWLAVASRSAATAERIAL
jgi:hypothetical protein